MTAERMEWAVHYPGESEPRPTTDEWTARDWLTWWNEKSPRPAVLVCRTVVVGDWEASS